MGERKVPNGYSERSLKMSKKTDAFYLFRRETLRDTEYWHSEVVMKKRERERGGGQERTQIKDTN